MVKPFRYIADLVKCSCYAFIMSFLNRLGRRDGLFVLLVVVLYVFALALPAAYNAYGPTSNQWTGGVFLQIGWLGILGGFVAWYANPLLLWALLAVLFKKYRQAFIVASIGFLLGLQTLLIFTGQPVYVPDDAYLVGPGPSYYLWQAILLVVAAYSSYFAQSTKTNRVSRAKRPARPEAL